MVEKIKSITVTAIADDRDPYDFEVCNFGRFGRITEIKKAGSWFGVYDGARKTRDVNERFVVEVAYSAPARPAARRSA